MKSKLFMSFLISLLPGLVVAAPIGIPPSGQLLASNCFQCHGTNGQAVSGFERLAGMSASKLKNEMIKMKRKTGGGIMDVHAAAYTDAQIAAMASYFASVKAAKP